VVNKEYIEHLMQAILHLHQADSVHVESVPVHEEFRWKGGVAVLDLKNHPKAKRVYAWSHRDVKRGQDERFVAALEIPPVDSPQTAVKVAIAAEAKGKE
jgi:hypothetical protein